METTVKIQQDNGMVDQENLPSLLDRGIDDMEAGRELPIDEAFQKINELRDSRRNSRA